MSYKPNYCCNCGVKIDRVDWNLLTSRKFCEVCEIEFKGSELLPKVGAAVLLVFGIFGAGSFLTKGEKPVEVRTSTIISTERKEPEIQKAAANPSNLSTNANVNKNLPPAALMSKTSIETTTVPSKPILKSPDIQANGDVEPTYFCGAATKKGTPCSRRVKGAGKRCWQHEGQPAMLSAEKLLVSR